MLFSLSIWFAYNSQIRLYYYSTNGNYRDVSSYWQETEFQDAIPHLGRLTESYQNLSLTNDYLDFLWIGD